MTEGPQDRAPPDRAPQDRAPYDTGGPGGRRAYSLPSVIQAGIRGSRQAVTGSLPGATALSRAGHLEYDRILFFSDAVFAIAITLLVVDLPGSIEQLSHAREQVNASAALSAGWHGVVGFWISFAVIGLFWVGHHGLFRYVTAFDRRLTLLNLMFLGTIAFLPYPTALLSNASSHETIAVIFYAGCAGTAGLVETLAWVYACNARAGLVGGLSAATRRLYLLRLVRVPVVFAVSIPVALVDPTAATIFWVAIIALGSAIDRRYGHHDVAMPDPPGPAIPPD
jgi:uncharacterized membrane protein